jgi:nucleoid DNA-binding protein
MAKATMSRGQLADKLAARMNITKGQSYEVVGHVFDLMREHIVTKKEGIGIHGFGIFKIKERGERNGRNPKTGESIVIAPSVNVKLQIAHDFKEALNQ